MNVLNSKTLSEALDMCKEYDDIHIAIVLKNHWSLRDLEEAFHSEIKNGQLRGWKADVGYRAAPVVFKSVNNSYIHLMNIRDSSTRSRLFHMVLYEDNIDVETLQMNAPIERLMIDDTYVTKELDEFLNSFKIIREG